VMLRFFSSTLCAAKKLYNQLYLVVLMNMKDGQQQVLMIAVKYQKRLVQRDSIIIIA